MLTVMYAGLGSTCAGSPGHLVLQPVNSNGTSVFKKGSTVPVKFRVCGVDQISVGPALTAGAMLTNTGVVQSFIMISAMKGTLATSVNEDILSTSASSAFRWDDTDKQWIFNLSTQNLSANGTYVYSIGLNDTSSITFEFGLK